MSEYNYEFKIDIQSEKFSSDKSIMGKVLDFQKKFEDHERLGHNTYLKIPLTSVCDRIVKIYDRHNNVEKEVLMFGSNSYLGAINNEVINNATIDTIKKYGFGSGGVPALSGTFDIHYQLERKLSELSGFDDSLLFSSGFTANIGAITGLVRPYNLIIHDKFNHASLLDGSIMSGAKMIRYRHNDLVHLEKLLYENIEEYKDGIMVVTDGVFSMDGDIANIPAILEIVRKYNAILLIDDAHATGVIGDKGRGTLSHYNIKDKSNIILTGTLSKALGAIGGYISADQKIINYLRMYARSNLYSTSLPPSVCASSIETINYMLQTDVVEKLKINSDYLRSKLREKGFNILNSVTAAIPVIVGDEYKLTVMAKELLDEKNIWVSLIVPPVVSPKLSRFRLSVMASHTFEDMDYLADSLDELFIRHQLK